MLRLIALMTVFVLVLCSGCASTGELTDKAYEQQMKKVDRLIDVLEKHGVAYGMVAHLRGEGEVFLKESAGINTGVDVQVFVTGNAQRNGGELAGEPPPD